jgi:hypothetical protein
LSPPAWLTACAESNNKPGYIVRNLTKWLAQSARLVRA